MTDQHPLTDKICFNILSNKYDVSGLDWHKYQDEVDLMRAAADWQLEQVLEWLKTNTEDYVLEDYYSTYFLIEAFLDDFKKAMRPTTQEENND